MTDRATRHRMYGTAGWQRRRVRQLRREPLCRLCLDVRGVATAASVADHVTPHRGDLGLFAGPLQSLCKRCHDSWKQAEEAGGEIKGCDVNGIPLDPRHPWRAETSGGGVEGFGRKRP